jgi:uncharacterized phage protein (TIGR02220 family)
MSDKKEKDIEKSIIMSSDNWVYGFTQIDNGVIDHDQLDIYDKMVYIAIKRMINQKDHITFPSYEKIGQKAGCSRRKAIDTVKRLETFDLIQNMGIHKQFGSNVYMIKRIQESSVLADPEKNQEFILKQIGKKPDTPPADPKKEEPKDDPIPYKTIIDHLNQKAGKKYLHTTEKNCRDFIRGRWGEMKKAGMDDETILGEFIHVIDVKVAQWVNDPQWKDKLRPSTLFRPGNFDRYRNEQPNQKPFGQSGQAPAKDDWKQKFLESDDE